MRSTKVTLGGTQYKVPLLNVGQLEALTDMFTGDEVPKPKQAFRVLEIALARAEPKVEQISEIACTLEEVRGAVTEILKFSGMQPAGEDKAKGEA